MEYLIVSAMATLMAEWTKKKEFDRPSRKISDSNER